MRRNSKFKSIIKGNIKFYVKITHFVRTETIWRSTFKQNDLYPHNILFTGAKCIIY